MNITERLADWLCAQRWQDIPETARRKAVDVVYDSVGAMIACSQLPEVVAIVAIPTSALLPFSTASTSCSRSRRIPRSAI